MLTQSSSSILSRLAVAASIAAISLSATAETRFWADSNGDTAPFNAVDSWDPAPSAMSEVASDTLALNKGVDKIAEVKDGDNVSVDSLYIGWGTNGVEGVKKSAEYDHGGRLDVKGGLLNVMGSFNLGGDYSDNANNVVNVTGGKIVASKLRTSNCQSNGGAKFETINVSGTGVFEIDGNEAHLATFGSGETRVNVTNGGTFKTGCDVSIGRAGKAVVNVNDANFDMGDKNLDVGHSGSQAVGELTLENLASEMRVHYFNIANGSGSTGKVVISGDDTSVKCTYATYLGKGGNGELTINGGLLSVEFAVQIGDNASGNKGVLNLNGGTLKVPQVNLHGSTAGEINWNGGIWEFGNSTFAAGGDMCPANPNITIRVLEGGAFAKVNNVNSSINFGHALIGEGAFVKIGDGAITLTGALNIQGGFKVEGGTLNITGMEQGTFDELSVAEGCSLDLGGASVSVKRYVQNGQEMPAGDHSYYNGSIHVLTAEEISAAVSKWTNAAGDGDVTNPANWDSWNIAGTMVSAAPTADTHIIVPYVPGGMLFEGFSDVTWVVEENVNAEVSNRPEVLNTAAAWYDPSDTRTLTTNEAGQVTAMANKGNLKADSAQQVDLDLKQFQSDKTPSSLSTDGLNGRQSIFFGDTSGFKSKGYFPADFLPNGERTVFAVAQGNVNNMIMVTIAQGSKNSEEGKCVLLAHKQASENYGCAYKVGYKNEGDSNWKASKVSYNDVESDTPYVFAGRTAVGNGDERLVISSAMSASGAKVGTLEPTRLNMPARTEGGEELRFNAYYGAHEVDVSWIIRDNSDGYQGEVLIFTNALSDAEMDEVNEYLRTKWLLSDGPVMTEVSNIVVDAELNLCGGKGTFASITGRGSFKNGTVVLNGDLVVTVNPDQVVVPTFDNLVLGENARLVVNGAKYLPKSEMLEILSFASIDGEFAAVVGDKGGVVLKYSDDGHIYARRSGGMSIRLR